jgi:RNA polymerase sigma factor (sigma-70 family)
MTNSVPEKMLPDSAGHAGSWRNASMEPAGVEVVDVLFRRQYPSLLRLGVVMLGSREAAEDAVQDAFVALHRHWRTLRDPEAAEAYLRSAVLNRCRSWVRREVTQRAARPLLLVREHSMSPEETAIGRDEIGSVVAAMRTLAGRQREVLACRYVLELSVAETASCFRSARGRSRRTRIADCTPYSSGSRWPDEHHRGAARA